MQVSQEFFDSDPDDMIRFAQAWSKLGDAIQSQVVKVMSGRGEECNPNAIKIAMEILEGFNDQLETELAEWLDRREDDDYLYVNEIR